MNNPDITPKPTGPSTTPAREERPAEIVAAHAAESAEAAAVELQQRWEIALEAAKSARIHARESYAAARSGDREMAREYARKAMDDAKTAADAASVIL
jgi:hypothetical protein